MDNNLYEIIYSDPPWPQTKGNIRKCRPNQNKNLDFSFGSAFCAQRITTISPVLMIYM